MQNNRALAQNMFVSLAVLLCACSGSSPDDATEPLPFDPIADQYVEGAINIGSLASLPTVRNAVLLGVEHVNDVGGVLGKPYNAIALVPRDTAEADIQGKTLVEAGIQVIQTSFSSRSRAVAAYTIPNSVLQISDSATSTSLTDLDDNDFFFRLIPSDIYQGQVIGQLALDEGASNAIAMINSDDAYGTTLVEQFQLAFEAGGGEFIKRVDVPESISAGFDQYLQQVYDENPDAIMNATLNPDIAANMVNESSVFSWDGIYIVPDTIAGEPSFVDNLADLSLGDGIKGTNPGFGLLESAEYQRFLNAYINQFELEPTAFCSTAYDFAILTALAIEHAGLANGTDNPTGTMIRDSIRQVMNPPGEKVSPSNLAQAFDLIRAGIDVDYSGAYSDTDFDSNGDVQGKLVYHIFGLEAAAGGWVTNRQIVIETEVK